MKEKVFPCRLLFSFGFFIFWLSLASQGAAQPASYEVVTAPVLTAGDAIPAPMGPVLLRINKATLGGGGKNELRLDLAALEKMGLIRYTIKSRYYPDPVTFEGVLGSAFLDVVGVPKGATKMRMRALNDYVATVPIADLRRWPVMFALKMNGKYMSVRDKGPVWVVYPAHIDEKLGGPTHRGKWIWQLVEINFQ